MTSNVLLLIRKIKLLKNFISKIKKEHKKFFSKDSFSYIIKNGKRFRKFLCIVTFLYTVKGKRLMLKSAKIVNFIYMVFCLHIQWLLHVVKGFIIAGIFPSTAAVYAVIRDLLLKKEIDSLSYTFSNYYSHNFKVANILGWLFFCIFRSCYPQLHVYSVLSGIYSDIYVWNDCFSGCYLNGYLVLFIPISCSF